MFDVDYHPNKYTAKELADYLRGIANDEEIKELAAELTGGALRQSGMEGSHEKWVLATLNFLTAMDIPFYRRDERGNRLKNDYEIPERLTLLREKISLCARRERVALENEALAKDKLRMAERQLEGYRNLISQFVMDMVGVVPGLRDRVAPTPPAVPQEVLSPPGAPRPDPAG